MRSRAVARCVAKMGALALVALGGALSAAAGEHLYAGVEKCESCHGKELMGDQVSTWSSGPHRRAFESLKGERSRRIAEERGLSVSPEEAPECRRCHVTAHGVSPLRIANDLDPADGVQCESCHGPGQDYRVKKIMSDLEQARAEGLWDVAGDPGICTGCHNSDSPTFDSARYALPSGETVGFDPKQAAARIAHPIPTDVKGHYVEIEERLKKEAKRNRRRR